MTHVLRNVRNGYFVELGAVDGRLLSNTLALEESFGWNGLCIEPSSKYQDLLTSGRRCTVSNEVVSSGPTGRWIQFVDHVQQINMSKAVENAALTASLMEEAQVDTHGRIKIIPTKDGMYSGILNAFDTYALKGGTVMQRQVTTIGDLLDKVGAPARIDFLSLDTEGSELDILSSFPFETRTLGALTVEHNHQQEKRDAIHRLMESKGYVRVRCISGDDVYANAELLTTAGGDVLVEEHECDMVRVHGTCSDVASYEQCTHWIRSKTMSQKKMQKMKKKKTSEVVIMKEIQIVCEQVRNVCVNRNPNESINLHVRREEEQKAEPFSTKPSDPSSSDPSSSSSDPSSSSSALFESLLPAGALRVIIDLGANLDPILPPDDDQSRDVHVLAFEPVLSLHARASKHPRLHMIPAAVSSATGLRVVRTYNNNALSSSLAKPTKGMKDGEDYWNVNKTRGDGQRSLVPCISLFLVLDELRTSKLEVSLIKTDIQGADFEAIQSAGESIRSVGWLVTEVWVDNVRTYQHFENDLCRNWVPWMTKMAYKLEAMICHTQKPSCGSEDDGTSWETDTVECCRRNMIDHAGITSGVRECDVIWRRIDAETPDKLPPSPPLRKEKWIKRFVDQIVVARRV